MRGRIDSTPDLVRNTVAVNRERKGGKKQKNRVNEPEEARERVEKRKKNSKS